MISNKQIQILKDTSIFNYADSENIKLSEKKDGTKIVTFNELASIDLNMGDYTCHNYIKNIKKIEINYNCICFKNSSGRTVLDINYENKPLYIKIYYHYIFDNMYEIEIKCKNEEIFNNDIGTINKIYPKFRYDMYNSIINKDIKYIFDVYVKPSIDMDEIKLLSKKFDSKDRCTINLINSTEQLESSKNIRNLLDSVGNKNGTYILYNNILYELNYIRNDNISLTNNYNHYISNNIVNIDDFIENKNILIYNNDNIVYHNKRLYNGVSDITKLFPKILLNDLNDVNNGLLYNIISNNTYINRLFKSIENPSDLNNDIKSTLGKINECINLNMFDNEILLEKTILFPMDNNIISISKEILLSIQNNLLKIYNMINQFSEFISEEYDE